MCDSQHVCVCVCARGNHSGSWPVGVDMRIALHAKNASATDALPRCNGPKKRIFQWVCGGRGCAAATVTNITAALLKASYQMTDEFLLRQRGNKTTRI